MSMADLNKTLDPNGLAKTRLAFIGCGVMAEAIIAGLLRKQLVAPEQVVGSHPRSARRDEIQQKFGVHMFEHNCDANKAVQPSASDWRTSRFEGLNTKRSTRYIDRRRRQDCNDCKRTPTPGDSSHDA